MMALSTCVGTVRANYTETMDPNSSAKDLKSEYGLVDDCAKTNQSDILQKAIRCS
jgi:hypothetical protein